MSALRAAQERLWFLHQLDPADASYHLPLVMHVRGPLDRVALHRALDALTRRHQSLRTRVELLDGEPVLAAAPGGGRLETAAGKDLQDARDLVAAFVTRPFDLTAGPVLRCLLIDAGPDGHVLALTAHHIAADGWSLQVLRRDLDTLYQAHATGTPAVLPELPALPEVTAGSGEPDLGYWTERLAGAPVLDLPTDHPRPPVRRGRGSSVVFDLPVDLLRRLEAVARAERTTVYTALVAAFSLLLGRVSGQDDICLGTPVLGRDDPDLAEHVGCFAETLVLRTDLSGDPTFRALLRVARRAVLGALSHAAPFERVVSALGAPRDRSRTPLFQAMIMYLRQEQDRPRLGDLDVELLDHPFDSARTDVSLDVIQGPDTAVGVLTVDRDLFDGGTAQRLIRRLLVLLDDAARRPDTTIGDLRWFDDDERREALTRWNDTGPGRRTPLIADLFQAQARATPDAVAVTGAAGDLTYRDLDAQVDRLAARLRGRGPLIGVGLTRGPAMVVALLAVWRAGAAYLPLDPAYPADRLAFVIADAGVSTVLTESPLAGRFGAASLLIDDDRADPVLAAAPATAPDDPAYVLYTSGSTGLPKGVVVPHGALAAFVAAMAAITGPQAGRAWLALTSLSFDISGLELYLPLSRGGRVVIAGDAQTSDGAALRALIAAHGVTDVQATPSGWRMLLAAGFDHDVPAALVGGEALPAALAAELRGHVDRLTNVYGPTETTIWSTSWPVPEAPAAISIGGPIPGTRVYVVDDRLRPVPTGVPGELVIAGAGVALGYLRRPRLTADRFVPDPSGGPGDRMYRTGDRVRRSADGTLEFLGRLDTQVKVRGHRIELGEVEAVLAGCPGVAAAVAVVRDDALAAYVTARPGAGLDPAAVRDAAGATLPGHAVPGTVTVLDALPLTPNGKVDRAALPDPRPHPAAVHVPPRTAAETRVAAVFAEVFGTDRVGAHDDFFALGGHSLLAAKVAARLPGLTVRDLFDHPAVEALALRIPAAGDAGDSAAPDGVPVVSDAQRRLWFLQRLDPHDASYNMFVVLRLRGRLDTGALRRALSTLAARHPVLRCAYPERDGDPAVEVGPAAVPLEEVAVESEAAARAAVADRTNAPFDLRTGAPVRATLIRIGPDDHVLCLVVHHIAGDGWSLNVLREDLAALYAGEPLTPLPAAPAAVSDPEADLAYWRERLAGPTALDLPTDRPRPAEATHRGGFIGTHLPAGVTARLEDLAGRHRTSLFAVLLAAYQVFLARHTGQDDILVGSTLAARDRVEIERSVGYFARTVVLRNHVDAAEAFTDLLGRARESVLDALTHTEAPFELLGGETGPLFQTMCILHTQDEGTLAFADLDASFFDSGFRRAKFDLMLEGWRGTDGLALVFGHDTDLLDTATVEVWARRFGVLCAGIAADPATAVGALPLLTADDEALVDSLAAQPTGAPAHPLVPGLPRLPPPDSVAVRCGAESLTYAELNRRADTLAGTLRAAGVRGPDPVVAVAAHRDIDTVVALLAVWRAGGAYLPIDPAQPAGRIARLVAGSGAVLTVGDAPWPTELPGPAPAEAALEAALEAAPAVAPGGAAYVLHTSGSTGTPKAVVVEHEALAARVGWMRRDYGLAPGDTIVQFAPLAFDTHAEELWPALAAGATVRLLPDGPLSLPEVLAGPDGADVTVLDLPTAYWHDLVAQIDTVAWPPRLRLVVLGGEAVHAAAVDRWHARFGGTVRLVNTYGPTEATIIATSTDLGPHDTTGPPPIGVPLPGVRVAVVGADLRPVPPGAYGELLLGGAGLARGYLGRDDLTRDRFVTWRGARCYRTGDRVRLRTDGRLGFAGRLDDQLKVRGFRIEPAEVEHHLLAHPGVTGAVVVAHNGALVAYVAGAAPVDALSARLAAQLPGHLVPDRWITLDALPRTPTGKIDRRALPPPMDVRPGPGTPPGTDAEQLIADVWADVLGLDTIGADDDFFALGGHSLLAVRVAARLRAITDLDLPIRLLFTHRRLADLAATVEQRLLEDLAGLSDAEVAGLLEAETS